MSQRARGWTITLNNYTEEEYKKLISGKHMNTVVKWIIGKEVAPDTGTPHLQGYFYFRNARALKKMKEINPRAHWEKAQGSPAQNFTYCSKENNFEQSGMIEKKTRPWSALKEAGWNWDCELYETAVEELLERERELKLMYGDNLEEYGPEEPIPEEDDE
jgi:hypothetical protein